MFRRISSFLFFKRISCFQEDVLEKQNRDGSLRFPHMKKSLTSCWGRYAWMKDTDEFDMDNHVIHVTNPVFRNRIVTSANIQVSICVAKGFHSPEKPLGVLFFFFTVSPIPSSCWTEVKHEGRKFPFSFYSLLRLPQTD